MDLNTAPTIDAYREAFDWLRPTSDRTVRMRLSLRLGSHLTLVNGRPEIVDRSGSDADALALLQHASACGVEIRVHKSSHIGDVKDHVIFETAQKGVSGGTQYTVEEAARFVWGVQIGRESAQTSPDVADGGV